MTDTEVVVVGGGMAGVSIAAAIAPRRRVVLLEQEDQLAQHATGRSAAAYVASYGPPAIRALTRASRPALDATSPEGDPVLRARPLLWTAFFLYACLDTKLARAYAVVGGLSALNAALIAWHLLK